ncbi:MAG: patatin-like phospholipase family protein [Rhizobiaceae bacterium]|nr:patatin-like phospholipase family protein [Rhizobiaceae bacterium]
MGHQANEPAKTITAPEQSVEQSDVDVIKNSDAADEPIRIDAQPSSPVITSPIKQRRSGCGGISLALGGGVARGWAHIGVLRAFDEAGIEITMIAGTSVGALVGGYYLSGKLDELETFARSITRANMLRYMDFSLRGAGLISGERLAKRMAQDLGGIDIEKMSKPFVAVATEIKTGHEIWLHDGPLATAIRCSYALPGVFQPVINCGKLLVDGAIVNPVPVSACRAYEPDVVIAVNLNSETFGKGTVIRASNYDTANDNQSDDEIQSKSSSWLPLIGGGRVNKKVKIANLGVTGVMMEAFNIIQDRIARTRLAGDPPDFTIRPRLKNMGLTEFHRADEAIERGYEEGLHRLAEMERHGMLEKSQ